MRGRSFKRHLRGRREYILFPVPLRKKTASVVFSLQRRNALPTTTHPSCPRKPVHTICLWYQCVPPPPANIVSRHSSEALLCFEQPPLDVTSTLAHGKLLPELLVSAGVTGVGPAEVICGSLPAEAIDAVHIASTAIAFVFAHPNNKEGGGQIGDAGE